MKRSDCILVHGRAIKGVVVKRSDCILVYGSTTKGDVKSSDCILVYGSTTKSDVDDDVIYKRISLRFLQSKVLSQLVAVIFLAV